MENELWGILYRKERNNPIMDSYDAPYEMPFNKDGEYLSNLENFLSFVNSVKKMVRKSKYYRNYVRHIKFDIGLNRCQVLSNIEEIDGEKEGLLEMHHGPILNLADIISIITDDFLSRGIAVNTFMVAKEVIKAHYEDMVQVVMLTETVHEAVEQFGGVFLSNKQAYGDLNAFLKKYRRGLQQDQIEKINRYIETSKKYDTFDRDLFKLEKNIKQWSDDIIFY